MCNGAYHISRYAYMYIYILFPVLLDFQTSPMYTSHEILHVLLFYYHLGI